MAWKRGICLSYDIIINRLIYNGCDDNTNNDLVCLTVDDVPLGEVLRFIKLLYNYEQWEMFLSLVEPARNYFEAVTFHA